MTRLAAPIDAGSTTLRFRYTAAEIDDLQAAVDAAQRALDYALSHYQGPKIHTRRSTLAAAEAALAAAEPYLDQEADFRVGQRLQLGESVVRVIRVNHTMLAIERGHDGSVPEAHAAGTELVAIPAPAAATLEVL